MILHESNTAAVGVSRRRFIQTTTAATLALAAGVSPVFGSTKRGSRLKVGVIGSGGRGTGAAANALEASPDTEVWAMGDVFPDRVEAQRAWLRSQEGGVGERVNVPDERCFSGFDAYQKVLASGVDIVVLATPPHFRPMHFAAAVAAGKHIFVEKPVAVDPAGIRVFLQAAEEAEKKGLCVVAGTQRRHETSYQEAMKRIADGAIGRVTAATVAWNQGGLWIKPRQPEWSDMEWQLRNWLYFAWLSGDHIVEQHVHNLDVANWAIGKTPVRCTGMGGRQVRTGLEYGHVFDHFAVEYEYEGGVVVSSQCRQIDGCGSKVAETIIGTKGVCRLRPGFAQIEGESPWQFKGPDNNPYVQEHVDLLAAIMGSKPVNEAKQVAHATLTAIMGRMSAYTGKDVTWDGAMQSRLDLSPAVYELTAMPTPDVAVPGKSPLV